MAPAQDINKSGGFIWLSRNEDESQ